MNRDEEVPPPGARGPGYIALPNECGPSDQTDLNRTVFLDPLGRWSIICEAEPDWSKMIGWVPKGGGRAPCSRARSASRSFPWLLESSR